MNEKLHEAISLFDAKEYSKSLEVFLTVALQGDCIAQSYLGTIYHCGLGTEQDGESAAYWYLKAAKQEVVQQNISGLAYHNLSQLYSTGARGLKPDKRLFSQYAELSQRLGVDI